MHTNVDAKQILRETTTFQIDQPNAINQPKTTNLERGRRTSERINLSYPGTKWCGPGSTAADYDDLGEHSAVDRCCRTHDHCDNMAAGETRYNLTNNDFFTRLHCDCDREFSECLHALQQTEANRIGQLYFTLRSKCYREDYPIYECVSYDTKLFVRRCFRYVLEDTQTRRYQWFDLPLYDGKLMVERLGGRETSAGATTSGVDPPPDEVYEEDEVVKKWLQTLWQ